MERRFNLIKSDFEKHEKRILPRFPFCYLTFKSDDTSRVYEIKDISHTGMQLSLKEDGKDFATDTALKGHIHWLGKSLDIAGTVKWSTPNRIGVEFIKKRDVLDRVQNFLQMEEMVKRLKPLHKVDDGLEIPARLKYWLRSDGPVEIFVWQHNDGEMSKFQVLFLETFVEWEDGQGLKTGRILSKRNVDTPLITEDEWVFNIDPDADGDKLERIKTLVGLISIDLLPAETKTFLLRQLS
ncbi:PilZ domain-containing protein [Peredibacter starrii]|uniref:PilZ domain-containing protein n=1 Tax=Peredibacter starrii TaxID=28202 RepID=A0AAX4HKX7_9BACT|nr:PilZ domain-containing protein [Peredibacter starrii]WPU63910.1 PilZ domain-containing protein [Peredibacter starrii]